MKIDSNQLKRKQALAKVLKECACAMRLPLFLNTITMILVGVLGIITANTLGKFADAAFNLNLSLGLNNMMVLAGCILSVVIVTPALGLLSDIIMLKNALHHDNIVIGHYLDKDPEKKKEQDSGETQYQLEEAPNELRIYWVNLFSKMIALPICFGYLIYCSGQINWILTGLLFLLALLKVLTPLFFKEKLAEFDRQEKRYLAKRRGYESDVVKNPYIIKLLGIKAPILNRMEQQFHNYYEKTALSHISYMLFAEQTKEFMNHFTLILMLLFGAVMVAKKAVSPGEFATLFGYLNVAQTLINDIGDIIRDYPLMINAANRVCDFYVDTEVISGKPVKCFGEIRGEELSFAYPNRIVFQKINFKIHRGEKVAVLGANGYGKSTLVKIICSLIKNYEGTIWVGGEDLKTINVEQWRNIIAYASQAPYIFSTTIRENIVMGNLELDNGIVDNLMEGFGLLSIAGRLVNSNCGFSGGEKQKISILRALLKKSEIMILDEPTNHLDMDSINALKECIMNTEKTVILITHDAFMLDIVDRIIQL